MASYYATKAFVGSFSEALSYELCGTGVTATLLCPGPTATEFAETAGVARSRLFALGAMDAATVARIGYRAMLAGRTRVVAGARNKLSVFFTRFMPRVMGAWIAATLNHSGPPATALPVTGR